MPRVGRPAEPGCSTRSVDSYSAATMPTPVLFGDDRPKAMGIGTRLRDGRVEAAEAGMGIGLPAVRMMLVEEGAAAA